MYTSWRDDKIYCQKTNGKIRDQNPRYAQGKLVLALFCSETNSQNVWDIATSGRTWGGYQLLHLAVQPSKDYAHPPALILAQQRGGVGCPWVSFHLSRVRSITASLSAKQLVLEPSHRLASPLCCVQSKHRKGYRGKCCSRCKLCLRHPCSYSCFCSRAWQCKCGFHQELLVMTAWKTVLESPANPPVLPRASVSGVWIQPTPFTVALLALILVFYTPLFCIAHLLSLNSFFLTDTGIFHLSPTGCCSALCLFGGLVEIFRVA